MRSVITLSVTCKMVRDGEIHVILQMQIIAIKIKMRCETLKRHFRYYYYCYIQRLRATDSPKVASKFEATALFISHSTSCRFSDSTSACVFVPYFPGRVDWNRRDPSAQRDSWRSGFGCQKTGYSTTCGSGWGLQHTSLHQLAGHHWTSTRSLQSHP